MLCQNYVTHWQQRMVLLSENLYDRIIKTLTRRSNVDTFLDDLKVVSMIYKATKIPTTPPHLDRVILDAAHNAVKKSRASSHSTWWPVALAASVIVGVLIVNNSQTPVTVNTVPQISHAPVKQVPATENSGEEYPATQLAQAPTLVQAPQTSTVAVKKQPAKSTPAAPASGTLVRPAQKQTQQPQVAKRSSIHSNLLSPVTASMQSSDVTRTEQSWLKHIKSLFKLNRFSETDKELQKFLQKYPENKQALALQKKLKARL